MKNLIVSLNESDTLYVVVFKNKTALFLILYHFGVEILILFTILYGRSNLSVRLFRFYIRQIFFNNYESFFKLYVYSIQDLFQCLYIMLYLVRVKYTTRIMCTTTYTNILVLVRLLVNFKSIQNNQICAPSKQNFKKVVIEGMSLLAKFLIAKFWSFFLITLQTQQTEKIISLKRLKILFTRGSILVSFVLIEKFHCDTSLKLSTIMLLSNWQASISCAFANLRKRLISISLCPQYFFHSAQ